MLTSKKWVVGVFLELHLAKLCTIQGQSRSLVIAVDVSIVRASVNLRVQLVTSVESQVILPVCRSKPLTHDPRPQGPPTKKTGKPKGGT